MLMGINPPGCVTLGCSVASAPVPPERSGYYPVKALWASRGLCAIMGDSAARLMMRTEWPPWCSVTRVDGTLPRLGGQPTLRLKDPLADDPGMGRGKLHDGTEDCGYPGMGLFIRGCHAGLWRGGVSWLVPHVAAVLLQLNQLPANQHARHDRGTEHLSRNRRIPAAEPENRRGHGGWPGLPRGPPLFQGLPHPIKTHSPTLNSPF